MLLSCLYPFSVIHYHLRVLGVGVPPLGLGGRALVREPLRLPALVTVGGAHVLHHPGEVVKGLEAGSLAGGSHQATTPQIHFLEVETEFKCKRGDAIIKNFPRLTDLF